MRTTRKGACCERQCPPGPRPLHPRGDHQPLRVRERGLRLRGRQRRHQGRQRHRQVARAWSSRSRCCSRAAWPSTASTRPASRAARSRGTSASDGVYGRRIGYAWLEAQMPDGDDGAMRWVTIGLGASGGQAGAAAPKTDDSWFFVLRDRRILDPLRGVGDIDLAPGGQALTRKALPAALGTDGARLRSGRRLPQRGQRRAVRVRLDRDLPGDGQPAVHAAAPEAHRGPQPRRVRPSAHRLAARARPHAGQGGRRAAGQARAHARADRGAGHRRRGRRGRSTTPIAATPSASRPSGRASC